MAKKQSENRKEFVKANEIGIQETSSGIRNWKTNEEFNKFWNFKERPEFIGKFLGKKTIDLKKKGPKEFLQFKDDETGILYLVNAYHQLVKEMEKHDTETTIFKIIFEGTKIIENGNKVCDFAIFFADSI